MIGKSHESAIGTLSFSPGSSVNVTAMAPASGSPLLAQAKSLFGSLPVAAKGSHTDRPPSKGLKVAR